MKSWLNFNKENDHTADFWECYPVRRAQVLLAPIIPCRSHPVCIHTYTQTQTQTWAQTYAQTCKTVSCHVVCSVILNILLPCIYTYTYAYICIHVYATYMYAYICIHVYAFVPMSVSMSMRMRVCVCVNTHRVWCARNYRSKLLWCTDYDYVCTVMGGLQLVGSMKK